MMKLLHVTSHEINEIRPGQFNVNIRKEDDNEIFHLLLRLRFLIIIFVWKINTI